MTMWKNCARISVLMPGQGMAAPMRTTTMTQSVKRMRWRSSGILKQLAKAESMRGKSEELGR